MPDGGVPVLSMVERALTLEGWRAVRRRLPPDLKRSLPISPPAHPGVAAALLGDVLRRRRRRIADEEEPTWRPKISDIATAYAVDRTTIEDWLYGTAYQREHGRLVIRGATALRVAQKVFAGQPPTDMYQAIEMLDADLQRRVRKPREPYKTVPNLTWIEEQQAPEYPDIGTGSGVSFDQLTALLANPDRYSDKDRAVLGSMVRQMLPAGAQLDPEWLRTGMGQAFWYSAVAAAKKKLGKKKARS